MSEPVSDPEAATVAPSVAAPAPAAEARPRRAGGVVLGMALAAAAVVALVAASPFWAPPVLRALPWSAETKHPAPDPAIAAVKAEESRTAASVQQLAQRIAALEAKPAPDLSAVQQKLAALAAKPAPDLAPLQQHLATVDKTIADLNQQVGALAKAAQAQPAGDPRNTALALVLLQIRDAIDTGRPFDAEYHALTQLAAGNADIAAAAAPLAGPAASGVASRAVLTGRLRQLAPQIATASPPPEPGWRSQIIAELRSLVTIRRVDGGRQSPAETAVSAAERAMASGDLAGAVDALAGVSGPGAAAAQPWLKTARDRLAVESALHRVQAALAVAIGGAAPAATSQGG